MSGRGKEYADEMSAWVLRNVPSITKSAGTRASLIKTFRPYGELLARIESVIADNDRIMAETRRANDAVVRVMKRALDFDSANLAAAEGLYALRSNRVHFISDDEIARRAHSMIHRNMNNGNGHHAPE